MELELEGCRGDSRRRASEFPPAGRPPPQRHGGIREHAGIPLARTADGKSLFVQQREATVHTIYRFNLATGEREPWKELVPPEEGGVVDMYNTLLTPDGKYYAFTCERNLSDLFLFEGLR